MRLKGFVAMYEMSLPRQSTRQTFKVGLPPCESIIGYKAFSGTDVEQIWRTHDSQGQILPSAFRLKSLKPCEVFPLRSEAVGPIGLAVDLCSGSEADSYLRLRHLHHSTLGLRVIKKKKKNARGFRHT